MKNTNCSFDKHPTPVFGDESTGTVFDAYVWEQNGRLRMDFSWRPRKANSLICIISMKMVTR